MIVATQKMLKIFVSTRDDLTVSNLLNRICCVQVHGKKTSIEILSQLQMLFRLCVFEQTNRKNAVERK